MTDTSPIDHRLVPLDTSVTASRYLSLRTFRADGSCVDTPIWFVLDGATAWFRTNTASAKVRRIVRDGAVELRPCNWRGDLTGDVVVGGRAFVADDQQARRAHRMLADRYGWQWTVVPMLPVPGVPRSHRGIGLRGQLRLARATELWAGSSIIGVELTPRAT